MPVLVDDMDNSTEKIYSGFPDRMYIIDKAGKIAYKGNRGPRGFKPDEMEDALKELLKNKGYIQGALDEDAINVEHDTFFSTSMKRNLGFNIYTPPEYHTGRKRYPVIYWLHGKLGDEWTGVDITKQLSGLIQAKKILPFIIVFVYGGKNTMYSDSRDGRIMSETALVKELIPFVDQNYRTIASSDARAVEGFSMGGFGAIKIALKYPDLFSSVISYGGALYDLDGFSSKHASIFKQMFDNDPEAFNDNSPYVLAKQNAQQARKKLTIRIVIGTADGTLRINQAFHEHLQSLHIPHEFEILEGVGHSWKQYYEKAGEKGFKFQAEAFKK